MSDYYKHSKSGEIYELLHVVEHSETHEKLAVYRKFRKHDYDSTIIWARPLDNFMGEIFIDGEFVPRFVKVENIKDIFTEKELEELKLASKSNSKNIDTCVISNLEFLREMN